MKNTITAGFQQTDKTTAEGKLFHQLYKDQTLLIKISGAKIENPDFTHTVRDIKALIADQIKIMLVFGGGDQIDQQWQAHGHKEPRPKKDGVALTTLSVLEDGVNPAYQSIKTKLENYFSNISECHFSSPEEINASLLNPDLGYTGLPQEINLNLGNNLNVVGFLGKTENGQEVNLNADDIVTFLAKKYSDQINELIFITPTGGILNKKGEIVSTFSLDAIGKILQNTHNTIKADGGMLKKLQEIQKLLQFVDKVALTGNQNIYHEITQLKGAGTLCVNLANAKIEPLADPRIFEVAYAINVQSGNWKERTDEEKAELKQHHFVLSVGNSPLGGYSLTKKPFSLDRIKESLCFECWWAGEEGNGIGSLLLQKAAEEAKSQGLPLFFHTHQNIPPDLTEQGKFIQFPQLTSSKGTPLWVKI